MACGDLGVPGDLWGCLVTCGGARGPVVMSGDLGMPVDLGMPDQTVFFLVVGC